MADSIQLTPEETAEYESLSGSFDTKLDPEQEKSFQVWKQTIAPQDSGADYDFRGAFLENVTPDSNRHWPDKFKKPNHPTFSNESQYAKFFPSLAGRWEGESFVKPTGTLNPIRDFSADELFDLAIKDKDNFDLVSEFRKNKDLWKDPGTVQKVADVNSRIKDRGFELSDIPGPGKIVRTAFDIAKGFGKQAWNYANALVGVPIASVMGEISGQEPGFQTELARKGQRRIMENIAGTEAATFGVARLGKQAVGKVRRAFVDQTPEEKLNDLWKDVGAGETEEEILKGKGGLLEPLGGEVRKELEATGKPIRPEEISQLAAGDPLSFYTFGKIFQGAGKITRAGVTKVAERLPAVEKVSALAEKAAEQIGGRAIQTVGNLTDIGGRAVKILAPAAGMIKGAIEAGPIGALAGLKGGEIAAKVGGKISKGGRVLTEAGKEIAGVAPVTGGVTQLTKDIIGGIPIAAAEIGKGLSFDIGLAALTAETPRDTESVGIGTFFGGLGAARRVGGRVISGQLIGPRAWGSGTVTSSSGKLPILDAMHTEAIQNATPSVQTRLNAIRQFLKGSNADTDMFLAKDGPALENTLLQMGISSEQAHQLSQTEGFFVVNLPDVNGNLRRVIIARNVDAAPHESFHAIQDVLGETANQAIDQIVREEYGPRWEIEGQQYASRIGPGDWREVILDSTGTGLDYAKEKISMDVANEYRAAIGAEPPSGFIQERAKAILGQVMDRAVQANPNINPNDIARHVWRDILSPQEAIAIADSYLARELAAENFDMVFKNAGPGLQNVSGLTGRLARIVAQLVSTLGGEPLSPERLSQIGQIAPRFRVTEAVRVAPGLVEPRPGPKPPSPILEPLLPTPSAESPTADEARKIAAEASETPVVAGTASPREILGNIAEAIAQQAGLKVNYLSAPGEPAAAIISNRKARRAVIEAFRTMPPEARALWEKNFFPDRVIKLEGNKYQILGWAPEVFASNAHKLAAKLQELGVADASPYLIKENTFTPEGWQELFKDTQTFVQNQMAGRTGAGEPLVVPREVTERGFYAPPIRGRAITLPQLKADFINMLFGIKLPETARIQKGKLPLNIAGQVVSEATLPGRTEIPVIPRGRFEGVEAERQGIVERQIMEVNPLRQRIEAAAQAKGIAMPEFIEAQQRLKLENIKNVEIAPELPQFRGNILTLSAGFQPKDVNISRQAEVTEENETRGTILAKKGRKTVGRLDYGLSKEEGFADIFGIEVEEDFRRQGIGRAMLENLRERAQIEGIHKVQGSITSPEAYELRKKVFGEPISDKIIEAWFDPEAPFQARDVVSQFQPSSEPQAIKSAAVKDERGKIWEGFWHGAAEEKAREVGAEGPFADGFTTNDGEFLTREQAFQRAKEMGQIAEEAKPGIMGEQDRPGLETSQLIQRGRLLFGPAKFQPPKDAAEAEEVAKKVLTMTPQEFAQWSQAVRPMGGFTEYAWQAGLNAPSQAFVDLIKNIATSLGEKATKTASEGKFEDALSIASQQQFFREAWEAATGEGSAGYHFRKTDPNYKPKFPVDRPAKIVETITSMQPKKELERIISAATRSKEGEIFTGATHAAIRDERSDEPGDAYGFITSTGRFIDRNEAYRIARKTQQLPSGPIKGSLAAEDIDELAFPVQMQPKKELKMKPAQQGFSKAWVLPDGKVVNIGGQWHHEFINENPELRKQYKLSADTSEENRVEALNKGFVRMNWDYRSGKLTIEARTKDWPKQRESVRNFVEANADKIDRMEVVLLSGKDLDKVDDAHEESVFMLEDNEKAAMLPFGDIGEKRETGQASERLFEKAVSKAQKAQLQPALKSELEKVRKGKSFGQTFDSTGEVWTPKPVDLVTLASVTVPTKELTSEKFSEVTEQYKELLSDPNVVAGVFALDKDRASIDINAAVPQEHRENTIQFAKDNDQISIWDADKMEEVKTGGTGDTKLKSEQIQDALSALLKGEKFQFQPESAPRDLFGEEVKRFPTKREFSEMTPKELGEFYPEAIISKSFVPSDIIGSPLFKRAINEAAAVKLFGDKLAEFARENTNNPLFEAGQNWYEEFTPQLKKEFGADADLFAELLAATSPQTSVASNFGYAVDAVESFRRGRFTKIMSKFHQGLDMIANDTWKAWYNRELSAGNIPDPPAKLTPASFMEAWINKHNLKPRQTNGSLYGTHSLSVLRVFARQWLTKARGPKALNFVENLLGTSDEATIDLWADRTMRRIGYAGEKRWRILPRNAAPVSDRDFEFSQKAFRHAAQQLGMKPSSLQAALWFAEKDLWNRNGWSKLDLGDFRSQMKRLPALRAGIEERLQSKKKLKQSELKIKLQ